MESTITTTLVSVDCGDCGITFGLLADRLRKLKENGEFFYCPNGHKIHYSESENRRLQRQLDRANFRTRQAETQARHAEGQQGAAERTLRSTKGHLTRVRRRVSCGLCPFCKRHFVKLQRHMETKHPDAVKQARTRRIRVPKGKR